MTRSPATLHLLCGKIGSGKSTLAARLANAPGTVLISEDAWLDALYADVLHDVADYVRCSDRLARVLHPHVADLLSAGVSVVLDAPANTVAQRARLRDILTAAPAAHRMHVLDVPDHVCLSRLRARNADGTHPFTVSEAQFQAVSRHFEAPTSDEGFDLIRQGTP